MTTRANDKPLVSIAIPTYRQANYLPICIDACWFQDYPNLEIIVVNAASPDDTESVLKNYQRSVLEERVSYASYFDEKNDTVQRCHHDRYPKDGRTLKVIHLGEDPGLSETYNTGIRAASGKYVTTIVSDDIPHPTMISNFVDLLESQPFDFVYSDIWLVDDDGRIIREFRYPDYDPKRCLADWYLMGSSKLWRKNLHEKSGYFSSEYPMTQDYELFFRFAQGGARFIRLPKVLYSVRWHGPKRKDWNHSPTREPHIHTESKKIAMRARAWLRELGDSS